MSTELLHVTEELETVARNIVERMGRPLPPESFGLAEGDNVVASMAGSLVELRAQSKSPELRVSVERPPPPPPHAGGGGLADAPPADSARGIARAPVASAPRQPCVALERPPTARVGLASRWLPTEAARCGQHGWPAAQRSVCTSSYVHNEAGIHLVRHSTQRVTVRGRCLPRASFYSSRGGSWRACSLLASRVR